MSNIEVRHSFFEPQFCQDFIDFFEDNLYLTTPYGESLTLEIFPVVNNKLKYKDKIKDTIRYIHSKVNYEAICLYNDTHLYIDFSHIVKWPENSFMSLHKDFPDQKATSIIYLNDNFTGGELIVENETFTPKLGSAVFFKGNMNFHGVNKITKGTRYTLATWYKLMR